MKYYRYYKRAAEEEKETDNNWMNRFEDTLYNKTSYYIYQTFFDTVGELIYAIHSRRAFHLNIFHLWAITLLAKKKYFHFHLIF